MPCRRALDRRCDHGRHARHADATERDELQGVIAHEFSHILNGDMRLNLRLIGVLYGLLIVALAGRFLLELGGRSRGGGDRSSGSAIAVLVAAGLAYGTWLYRRVLRPPHQGGVSRQREFLAMPVRAVHANPDGIGGALRKIAGLGEQSGLGSRSIIRRLNRSRTCSWVQLGRVSCVAFRDPSADGRTAASHLWPGRRRHAGARERRALASAVSNRRRSRHGARRSSMCRQLAWHGAQSAEVFPDRTSPVAA